MVIHIKDRGWFKTAEQYTISGAFHALKREPAFTHVWSELGSRNHPFLCWLRAHSPVRRFAFDEDGRPNPLARGAGYWHNYLPHGWAIDIPMVEPVEVACTLAWMFGLRCRLCGEVGQPFGLHEYTRSAIFGLSYEPYCLQPRFNIEALRRDTWAYHARGSVRDMPFVEGDRHTLPLLCEGCVTQVLHHAWKGVGIDRDRRYEALARNPSPVLNYSLLYLQREAREQVKCARGRSEVQA